MKTVAGAQDNSIGSGHLQKRPTAFLDDKLLSQNLALLCAAYPNVYSEITNGMHIKFCSGIPIWLLRCITFGTRLICKKTVHLVFEV